MEAFCDAYVKRLQERIESFDAVLQGLPPEALDWSPGPELNTLAVLVTHTVASVRYMIGDVVAGDASGRVRAAEFEVSGIPVQTLRQRLADVLAYSQGVVAKLSTADLGVEHFSPQHNCNFTVAMSLLRALDHSVEHLGHAQITRMLWEQKVKTTAP